MFWHTQDRKFYCADVFRCEARYGIQASREELGLPMFKVAAGRQEAK